jgi:hypothetical protein
MRPVGIARYAGLLRLDADRVRRWLFARLAAEPRENWAGDRCVAVARMFDSGE